MSTITVVGDRLIVGPRVVGPHVDVIDEWRLKKGHGLGPGERKLFPFNRVVGGAIVGCRTCGVSWPEGGAYPPTCR